MLEPILVKDFYECKSCGDFVKPIILSQEIKICPSDGEMTNLVPVDEVYKCSVCDYFLVMDYNRAKEHVNLVKDETIHKKGLVFFSEILGHKSYNLICSSVGIGLDHGIVYEISTLEKKRKDILGFRFDLFLSSKNLKRSFNEGYFRQLSKDEFKEAKRIFGKKVNRWVGGGGKLVRER